MKLGSLCFISEFIFCMYLVNLKHGSVTPDTRFMGVTIIVYKYSCSDQFLSPKIKCGVVEEGYIIRGNGGKKGKTSSPPKGPLG